MKLGCSEAHHHHVSFVVTLDEPLHQVLGSAASQQVTIEMLNNEQAFEAISMNKNDSGHSDA